MKFLFPFQLDTAMAVWHFEANKTWHSTIPFVSPIDVLMKDQEHEVKGHS